MLGKFITFFCLANIIYTSKGIGPEVLEFVDEPQGSYLRVPRQFLPPSFNYRSARQQDLQKMRYYQQQRNDLLRFNNAELIRKGRTLPLDTKPTQVTIEKLGVDSWKVINPKYHKDNKTKNTYSVKIKIDKSNASTDLEPQASENIAVSLKRDDNLALPAEYYIASAEADDGPEENLEALNNLLGKNPSVQLEGLQQLLQSGQAVKLQGPQPFVKKDHVPIVEETVEAQQTRVPMDKDSFDKIQAHLDVTAHSRAQKALEHAQKQALRVVEEQHRAIEVAKVKAQEAALAKIEAQNAAIAEAYGAVHKPPASEISNQIAQSRVHSYGYPQVPAAQYPKTVVYKPQPLYHYATIPQVPEEPKTTYVYPQPAKIYQPLLVQKPEENYEKVVEDSKKAYGDDDLQYASKYAFGYRIRDYHSGSDFGHEEKREGKIAKGHYHVLLPDGRIQNVDYYADPTGYHAKVTYSGAAHH